MIHHDVCWNPSILEQRTGRVDRISTKIERCGLPIHIYLPYVSETQDEKQIKVVMARDGLVEVIHSDLQPIKIAIDT